MKMRFFAAVAALTLGSTATAAPVLAPPATLGPDVQPPNMRPASANALKYD